MTTPGPKPKPAELAELQGNPGHRPIAKGPELPLQPPADQTAPEWLGAEARVIWGWFAPKVRGLGWFKATDVPAFGRYCEHLATWLRLKERVAGKGESYTTTSNHGTMERLNPDFVAMLRVEEKLVALEDRFGLTPSARQQLMRGTVIDTAVPTAGTTIGGAARAESSPIGLFAAKNANAAAGDKPN